MKFIGLRDQDFVDIFRLIDQDQLALAQRARNDVRVPAAGTFKEADTIPQDSAPCPHDYMIRIWRDLTCLSRHLSYSTHLRIPEFHCLEILAERIAFIYIPSLKSAFEPVHSLLGGAMRK